MLNTLAWALGFALLINGLMFAVAFRHQSDKLTDISYAVSFVTLAWFGFAQASGPSALDWILAVMVTLWGIRLGGFLLYRVIKHGKDGRFDDIRGDFWQFGRFWLGQAITVWILMLPVLMAFGQNGYLATITLVGVAAWLVGLLIEGVADWQKSRFRAAASNRGRWIDEGLWHYSRHPNYLGEIMVWIGLYLTAFSALSGAERLIGLISPLTITVLLVFISGIPFLEKAANKRWGFNPAYQAYRARTGVLIPFLKR